MLASKPKLSVSSVLSGDYMEKYENYLADQFAGRDFLRNIKVTLGRFGGNKDENGVLLGKQGQLLEEDRSAGSDDAESKSDGDPSVCRAE